MKKIIGLVALLASSTVCADSVESKVVELRIQLKKPVIETRLKTKSRIENLSDVVCSGAFIGSNGEIITARHCMEKAESIEVITEDKKKYTATIATVSANHDLALILIDKRNTPFFVLASSVTRGEQVSVYGSPLGITDVYSHGTVARIDGDCTLLDCGVLPGNSGGPVLNSKDELVGVATAGFVVGFGMTHLNIAQGIDAIYFFLNGRK